MGGLRRLVRKVVRRKAAVPDPQTRRQQRIADAIRASGLFDAEWYREQLSAPLPPGTDPVEHYVTVGSTTDISPNPCFDTEWYRQSPLTPQRLDVAPFIHYVNRGAARNLPPHPMFDPEYYLEQHPEAAEHPGGALGHYLQEGWRTGALPSADFDLASYRRVYGQETAPPLADFIKRTRRLMEETRGWEPAPPSGVAGPYNGYRALEDLLHRITRAHPMAAAWAAEYFDIYADMKAVQDAYRTVLPGTHKA